MRIVDEIQHLLRLAEDPGASSAERDLAMRRAEKLMVRHRLQADQLHQDGGNKNPGYHGYWRRAICGSRCSAWPV